MKLLPRRFAPAPLQRELPRRAPGRRRVEGNESAPPRGDAPSGDGSGKICVRMTREQQAGRARGLRGKTEAAGRKRRLDLDLGKCCDQRATLQPFFQSPGCVVFIPGHYDESKSGVEAGGDETRSIGASPLKRGLLGEAPQHEIPAHPLRRRLFGDNGKGESKRGRLIAVSFRLDLVKPASLQLVEGASGVILRGSALCASHLRMTFRDLNAVILRWRPKDALEG